LVDAPRAFSIKLRMVTENVCKLVPSSVDLGFALDMIAVNLLPS